MPDREAAKRLILKIVAIAGGQLEAKARLHKAFYAAHIIYWRERQGLLTDYPVVKLPNGPGIDDVDGLLAELEAEGALSIVHGTKGPYTQTVIILKAAVQIDPAADDFDAIRRAVRWVKTHTTAQLTRITHNRPSYSVQMGYEQPIYLDSMPEDEYERVREVCEEVDDAFRTALGA